MGRLRASEGAEIITALSGRCQRYIGADTTVR